MGIIQNLSVLALRQLLPTIVNAVGHQVLGGVAETTTNYLTARFTDHSQRFNDALLYANERAWNALEVALAGESILERCKVTLASADDKGFRQQVQLFLNTFPLPELTGKAEFRRKCLAELQGAKKKGITAQGQLTPKDLARQTADFIRFSGEQIHSAEQSLFKTIIADLEQANCSSLCWLLSQQVSRGTPLLVVAVRYFFRREVESDPQLAAGMTFTMLDQLNQTQMASLQAFNDLATKQAQQMSLVLDSLQGIQAGVASVSAVQVTHGKKLDELLMGVNEMLKRLGLLANQATPTGASIRTDQQFQQAKDLLCKWESVPEADRQRASASQMNAVGKLQLEAGEVASAQRTFSAAAQRTSDAGQKAEAHFNAYRAALEKRDWGVALQELTKAAQLDPKRFATFPMGRYQPLRILGAGGFGVAFLCQHKFMDAKVVVKTLTLDSSERDADKVFSEARLLKQLEDPQIIQMSDCGYVDQANKSRPYLVMDYFDGVTLEDHVETRGTLQLYDVWCLIQQIASGLQEAHEKGIFHRDIKPANILVRWDGEGWQSKIIDFGLALKQDVLQTSATVRSLNSRSTINYSITGTLEYAPPEQLGRNQFPVGPYSDLYSFGKTWLYALFKTTQPNFQNWKALRKPKFADWLCKLVAENPKDRFANFEVAMEELPRMHRPKGWPNQHAESDDPKETMTAVPAAKAEAAPPQFNPKLFVLRGQKPSVSYSLREGPNLVVRSVDIERYVDQLLEKMDTNKDGKISRQEATGRVAEIFNHLDLNKDGVLDKDELRKAVIRSFSQKNKPIDIDLKEQDAPERLTLSREHALIVVAEGKMFIEDAESANGTYLNRSKLPPGQKHALQDDDIVQMGQIKLQVRM